MPTLRREETARVEAIVALARRLERRYRPAYPALGWPAIDRKDIAVFSGCPCGRIGGGRLARTPRMPGRPQASGQTRYDLPGVARVIRERSRAHHFVPRFHLRAFSCDPSSRRFVLAYDTKSRVTKRLAIARTALRNDYYTTHTPAGPSDDVERSLAAIERQAARAIRELLLLPPGPLSIPTDVRTVVATYVAVLWTRVPASRRPIEELAERMALWMTQVRLLHAEGFANDLRATGWAGTDEEADAFRRDWLDDLQTGRGRFRATEAASLGNVGVGLSLVPEIRAMSWRLVTVRTSPYFVLGDAPVSLWGGPDTPPGESVGLLSPGAELAVPLCPETTLVASFRPSFDYHVFLDELPGLPGPTARALPYLYRSLLTADRLVYARSQVDLDAVLAFAHVEKRG
jgi:hypothetical protein